MPLYEFKCGCCEYLLEISSREPPLCPICEHDGGCFGTGQSMKRVYSFGVGSVSGAGNTPSRTS